MSGDWTGLKRLLAVRLDALGDVLMTSPAFRALKEVEPDRQISLLCSPAGAAAAALIPELDEVIVYEPPWMGATSPRPDGDDDRRMVERLSAGGFDGAVIFTVYDQSPLPAALLCYLADIPRRLAHCRENPHQLLTQWVPEREPEREIRHEVVRQLELVAAVGAATTDDRMRLRVPPHAFLRLPYLLRPLNGPWVVLHPGASAPSRRYPAEGFREVARRLSTDRGWTIVFTGEDSERDLVEEIRYGVKGPTVSLVGKLPFPELAALLSLAPLLITNNTGPAHVAAAVGTPVVDLYALTNPQHTPWRVPHRVLFHDVPCKYCYENRCPETHHDCLRRVEPDQVVQAAVALFEETGGARCTLSA